MRIILVDDSALVRNIMRQVLEGNSDITIAAEASNGLKGVEMVAEHKPDLVIMDIKMPVMDGLDATQQIMQSHPVPIIIFSNEINSENSFKALQHGALDIMKKPDIDQFNNPDFFIDFIKRLKSLATVKLPEIKGETKSSAGVVNPNSRYGMIVIGASTGGPKALSILLKKIPRDFPTGMVLVQHMETGFDGGFANWLNNETELTVRLARNNDFPGRGELLVAPNEKHLIFHNGKLMLDDGPKVLNQKPSINRLFTSAASEYGSSLIGILLTGTGSDGADGCVDIRKRGGRTLVQNEATSTVFGMPKAAIERGGADVILPLEEIPDYLVSLTGVK